MHLSYEIDHQFQMQKNLHEYQDAMDKLTVAGKMMDNTLNSQTYDENQDKGV